MARPFRYASNHSTVCMLASVRQYDGRLWVGRLTALAHVCTTNKMTTEAACSPMPAPRRRGRQGMEMYMTIEMMEPQRCDLVTPSLLMKNGLIDISNTNIPNPTTERTWPRGDGA